MDQCTKFRWNILFGAFWRERTAKNLGAIALGVGLLWLAAKLKIPFYPVPQTMQVFVLYFLAMAYGRKLAPITVFSYIGLGMLGFPLFADTPEKGIGLPYVFGPTGGYLLGFVLFSLFFSLALHWVEKNKISFPVWKRMALFLGALGFIYIPGMLWLSFWVGWQKIFAFGFHPFILAELLKVSLAVVIYPSVSHIFKKEF